MLFVFVLVLIKLWWCMWCLLLSRLELYYMENLILLLLIVIINMWDRGNIVFSCYRVMGSVLILWF